MSDTQTQSDISVVNAALAAAKTFLRNEVSMAVVEDTLSGDMITLRVTNLAGSESAQRLFDVFESAVHDVKGVIEAGTLTLSMPRETLVQTFYPH